MVQAIPFSLRELYIEKKIHPDTLNTILAEKRYKTFHQMYNIVNEVKERQDFLQMVEHNDYFMTAAVTTVTALKGDAREQYRALKFRGKKEFGTPHYRIRAIFTNKTTGKDDFDFTYRTSNRELVYNTVPRLVTKINKLLWKKD